MKNQVFISLPVKDVEKSTAFFSHLGFGFNPDKTGKEAACMILNDQTFVMLLEHKLFQTFIKKEISDTGIDSEMIIAFGTESREKVDETIEKVIKAGGSTTTKKQ